jgi:hypothetical protein
MRVFVPLGNRLRGADLLFEGDQPVLVLSWRIGADGRAPEVAVPLDRRRLRPVPHRPNEYIYLWSSSLP